MKYWVQSIGILLLLFIASTSAAGGKNPGKVIAGWVEKISFADNELFVKAKLDTGAKTSSIFAKEIKKYKIDGKRWVDFTLVLQDAKDKVHEIPMSAPRARGVRIKNHDGDHDRRTVVNLGFCFDGRHRDAEFTLAERTECIYPVLLGRAFLKEVAIIDPDATFLTKPTCKTPVEIKAKSSGKTNG